MNKKNFLSNNIAKGGIFTAISIICLYLSILIPVNTLFFLIVASALIPLTLLSTNIKTTFTVYGATSLLSLILIPSKGIALGYIILFGIYGIIKFFIECINKPFIELLLKFLFFNSSLGILYCIYKTLLFKAININLPYFLILILAQFAFIIFDYALTVFINYSEDHLLKRLK
ncbi:hypothetical protein [Hathewaya limosa]|uniref:Membrane protein n=1 Tax=Hathewaya limosa TaxID=1536 RepID=A0ABU0JUR0_HATLI|nr:hypothetical protein [Hathewaya limosa]MDQ0479951.1 putative membrane protein [Hathewaya limosa]